MKGLLLPLPLGLVLAAAIAACGSEPTPSGPGTASLEIRGTRGACHSFGGCAYVARLDGPGGNAEAGFVLPTEGPDMALGADFPVVLSDGDYQLTFELRLMSDLLTSDGSRDFGIGATCEAGLKVGPGRSHIMVRVTFGVDMCAVSLESERVETSTIQQRAPRDIADAEP